MSGLSCVLEASKLRILWHPMWQAGGSVCLSGQKTINNFMVFLLVLLSKLGWILN